MGWFLPLLFMGSAGGLGYANRGSISKTFNEKAYVVDENGEERHLDLGGAWDGTVSVVKGILSGFGNAAEKGGEIIDGGKIVLTGRDENGVETPRYSVLLPEGEKPPSDMFEALSMFAGSASKKMGKEGDGWNIASPAMWSLAAGVGYFLLKSATGGSKTNMGMALAVAGATALFFNWGNIKGLLPGGSKPEAPSSSTRNDDEYDDGDSRFDMNNLDAVPSPE